MGFQGDLSHLSLEYVKNLEIPLPAIEEQAKIVMILTEHFGATDRARAAAEAQLAAIGALPAALLRTAFNGEL